ncbi:MAG TPA: glycoside hydrolase family 19 protein [Streptomyces sp.]|uniref:glycoside hydrolase family 19 protein n=1 Tax=Streptomyces sp. TaxID=1931 RepID=UPI002D24B143|nr:glycoside hydrolase family 19 protein [Streptomyces sp.]HZG04577.1 glycoside hydrolase family 19 protein [Streptomyces sp.]
MSVSRSKRFSLRRIAFGRLAVTAALAAVLSALSTAVPAQAADGQITGLAGKCVDVAGANSANGTAVQLYECNGTAAQRWSNPGDGTLRALGKCLDVVDRSTADGAAVQLWDCTGGANQQWVVTAAHDIVNPAADKCLDVRDNNSANGTRLQIWTCTGAANQKWNAPAAGGNTPSGFVVTETQFNRMFPNRNGFYTYSGLVQALNSYPAFATTGDDTTRKREAAAFLANVSHETGGLVHIVEQNTANYPHYCDSSRPYGCPAGQAAYYGRGPIQLSWNFNYKAAGDALGIDLLGNPWLVQNDAAVAWRTGLWYWNTQSGPGTMTPHNAMVSGAGFGQTIRSINGALECDGRNPAQVQSRVAKYQEFTAVLGVSPGDNLYC